MVNFCTQELACERLESTQKVEEYAHKVQSIKEFIDKNRDNTKLIKEYLDSVQPTMNKINNAVSQEEHAGM